MKSIVALVSLVLSAVMLTGCGRPPPAGGPPGDFPVTAVIAPVVQEPVAEIARVVGTLQARNAVDIVTEINAPVKEILFREGESVAAGQVLVQLDDSKVLARVAEAEARFTLAETNRKRGEELFANATISRQEYDQIKAEFGVAEAVFNLLKQELEDTVIRAPFSGTTSARLVSPGQWLSTGQTITRLVQMDPLEIEFRLAERHAIAARPGQAVVMRSASLPEEAAGEIFFIDPVVDPDSRTVLVKSTAANPGLRLKPGMYANVEVVLNVREEALVIPESAVRYRGDQAYVVMMNSEGKAEFRNVAPGQRLPGRVEISEGLAAGDRVVVEGFQKMGPGTTIIISPASARYGIEAVAP